MKICLVQPSNDFQVSVHRYALPLTFPYLIKELALEEEHSLCIYIENKTTEPFIEYLNNEIPDLLFITSSTSTFPNSVRFAKIAKKYNYITVLGGLFPTMNAQIISKYYACFDYIVTGNPPSNLLKNSLPDRRIIHGSKSIDIDFELAPILNLPLFSLYRDDPVCYEITCGCQHNCNFCSLRSLWGKGVRSIRSAKKVSKDFKQLSSWKSLKIIDDDILQSPSVIENIEDGHRFSKIVAETRVDRITKQTINLLKNFGITHLIIGVESFDFNNLKNSCKTSSKKWMEKTNNAIELCVSSGIVPRPVMQLFFPEMSQNYFRDIKPLMVDWKPQNGIEIFFVFFTPHPGLPNFNLNYRNLITNDLSKFDHLTPVYKPELFDKKLVKITLEEFNEFVDITNSKEYNPSKEYYGKFFRRYNKFF